jgi:hypothetical protein
MLRCIFVGSPNRFTEFMVHWLSKRTDLVGAVWTSSAEWAKTFPNTVKFVRRRLARHGLAKALNEIGYYYLSRKLLRDHAEPFQSRLYNDYVQVHGKPSWKGDFIHTDDINSSDVVRFVRERHPDLIMSMCINEFFKKEIRETPRLGSFLWHEGIVPEYKGLYSPFWAIHNREPEMLGYSVLRMNGQYDDGEVFLQGQAIGINTRTDSPLYIGHKAILDSLPQVGLLLEELERGTAKPLSIEGRTSGTYTYPGLTDWIRMKIRSRGKARQLLTPVPMNSSMRLPSLADGGKAANSNTRDSIQ